jgi:hypothetical protein
LIIEIKSIILKKAISMKKVIIGVIALFIATTVLQACSSKLCPAYVSYPKSRR